MRSMYDSIERNWRNRDFERIAVIEGEQREQNKILKKLLSDTTRQIELLERIVAALESRQDDGR